MPLSALAHADERMCSKQPWNAKTSTMVQTVTDRPVATARSAPTLLIAVGFLFVNLTLLFVVVRWVIEDYNSSHGFENYIVTQDFWEPFVFAMWAQAALNGLVLLAWKATRRVGLGVLLGTAAAVPAVVLWEVVVVFPKSASGSGIGS
jgi:hypothetical protein